jgi:hypothetical protein
VFRYVSGALDTAGALLNFIPRWTSPGALIITCTVGLGTVLCFTKALYNPSFPMVMTLLAATLVGLAWRPKMAWRVLRPLRFALGASLLRQECRPKAAGEEMRVSQPREPSRLWHKCIALLATVDLRAAEKSPRTGDLRGTNSGVGSHAGLNEG